MFTYQLGAFDRAEPGKSADFNSFSRGCLNRVQSFKATDIHQVRGSEELLLHGRDDVGAAGNDLEVTAVSRQKLHRLADASRPKQLKGRETHCSSPVSIGPAELRRAGSSA